MSEFCIFCRILKKEIPSAFVKESETAFCIRDMHSQAKEHLLIIPKVHVESLNDLSSTQRGAILPELYRLADEVSQDLGFKEKGYRSVINNQTMAGQSVFHLHLHILGGEPLKGQFGAR